MRLSFESQVSSWSFTKFVKLSDKVEILSCVLLRVSSRSPASTIALLLSLRRRPRRRNAFDNGLGSAWEQQAAIASTLSARRVLVAMRLR